MPPGTPVPTSEHPVQTFQWGDYSTKPGTKYRCRVVPATGAPKLLKLRDELAVAVDIETEPLYGSVHSVFFNRGAAGSQAYVRKFQDPTPDSLDPGSEQMKWLSRGLYEALIEFIRCAKDRTYGLRAARCWRRTEAQQVHRADERRPSYRSMDGIHEYFRGGFSVIRMSAIS
jgi:hypothetical protein